jgi:hypothetical protein
VLVGVATGLAILGLLKKVIGIHLYVTFGVELEPCIVYDVPKQIAVSGPAFTFGKGFTSIVTESVPEQPKSLVIFTVYVVVTVGQAVGLAVFELLKLESGDHWKIVPPVPPRVTHDPKPTNVSSPAFG